MDSAVADQFVLCPAAPSFQFLREEGVSAVSWILVFICMCLFSCDKVEKERDWAVPEQRTMSRSYANKVETLLALSMRERASAVLAFEPSGVVRVLSTAPMLETSRPAGADSSWQQVHSSLELKEGSRGSVVVVIEKGYLPIDLKAIVEKVRKLRFETICVQQELSTMTKILYQGD